MGKQFHCATLDCYRLLWFVAVVAQGPALLGQLANFWTANPWFQKLQRAVKFSQLLGLDCSPHVLNPQLHFRQGYGKS